MQLAQQVQPASVAQQVQREQLGWLVLSARLVPQVQPVQQGLQVLQVQLV